MDPWGPTTLDSLRNAWADLLIALVRAYRGKRTTMWSRIPDMMCSAARQTSQIDRWYTMTLRSLQIESQGSASSVSSLCSTWATRRPWLLALGHDRTEVERRALRVLRDDRDTITALAQLRWDEIKAQRAAAKAAGAPIDDDLDGLTPVA